jgi:hypothetical protein
VGYRVYLSSTLKDLEPERRAVQDALADQCIVRHSYSASEQELVESCLSDVEQCDLYIVILGLRYGPIAGRPFSNPKKLSITELEYRHAGSRKIPRLVFLKDESVIPVTATDWSPRNTHRTGSKSSGRSPRASREQPSSKIFMSCASVC